MACILGGVSIFDGNEAGYRISKQTGRTLIGVAIILDVLLPFFNLIPIFGSLLSGAVMFSFMAFFMSKNIRSARLLLMVLEMFPIVNLITGWLPMFTISTALTVRGAQKKDEERIAAKEGRIQ